MPISRALESLNPKENQFDIVIIDEASQSDVSSLAILYMGKKLIIVGDDKQVSPMAVGTDTDKMIALEQMYLHDKIPNSHLYNAKTSIYDIAATTFQPLMLREHFRCVPEIIGFSNMLSYDYNIKQAVLRQVRSELFDTRGRGGDRAARDRRLGVKRLCVCRRKIRYDRKHDQQLQGHSVLERLILERRLVKWRHGSEAGRDSHSEG